MNRKERNSNNHADMLEAFGEHLKREEKSRNTITKYTRDAGAFLQYLAGEELTKEKTVAWKELLVSRYAAASVNSMLAALNHFLDYIERSEYKVKPLKLQREIFSREDRELTRDEYKRLVRAAESEGNRRLALILQTICATGIRVSELSYITLDAVRCKRAQVNCKGKRRTVFLPEQLCRLLKKYASGQKKGEEAVFVTKNGKPVNRSNIWREMKLLCARANVEPQKVFPHNLRHLFARTYYRMEKDLLRLADILGHASINTTRIYTMESGLIHMQQIGRMGLVIT